MPLSSNSLIHLTKTKESLIGILHDGFKVHYCNEKICTKIGDVLFAVPCVCFCDIPLSEIKNHISNYGCYGIGLKKEWAIKKGLNPILYIEKESDIGGDIKSFLEHYNGINLIINNEVAAAALINLLGYMKNYEGNSIRGDHTIPNYRYSDEREWRFVHNSHGAIPFLTPDDIKTQEQINNVNIRIENIKLDFTPDDITYIIIKEESEILSFINIVRELKGEYYHLNQVEKLTTRILTVEQINTDF
jgi:hypothetical protein